MTNKFIRKTAKNFLKELDFRTDFVSVEEYLKKLGYKVIFFNSSTGDRELERFNLKEKSKYTNGFTYIGSAKIIFINSKVSAEDKKYLLYHEAGHILLGHMDYPRMSTKSDCLMEFEADTFAHLIVNPPKTNKTVILMTALTIIAMTFSFYAGKLSAPTHVPSSNFISESHVESAETQNNIKIPENDNETYVYITPTGKKYHRENCRYVNSGSKKVPLSAAMKTLSPCSVCKP